MNPDLHDSCAATERPPPASTGHGPGSAQARRLARLFRHSLARGEVHPLLHVLKCHHGIVDGLAPLTAATRAPTAAAPQARIAADGLRTRVATLPSLPQVVRDAMAMLEDEGASMSAVAERIEQDQALTARTLRAANLAFYGAPGRVANIRLAVRVLGLRTLAALLVTASVSAQFSDCGRCPEFRFKTYWRHALTAALVARGLAQRAGLDGELAYTAGLLHDIGLLVLATLFPDETGTLLRFAREHDLPALDAERAVLGVDHCVTAEILLRQWHLPAAVVQALASHHEPPDHPAAGPTLADIVNIADALACGIRPEDGPDDVVPPVTVATWTRVGVGIPDCLALLESTADSVEALCEALSL